ncbi:MAG: endolytic transglycosylase MltG [Culturomica sp.]|jgi:UPF0755 protein|nr:endolytic transglycosylase MltG [Culturomica sp.]
MKRILRILVVAAVLAALAAAAGYYVVLSPNTEVNDDARIYIREGDRFETVLDSLQSRSYVKNSTTLRWTAELKRYSGKVKPGCYRIEDGMNNNDLINLFRSGNQLAVHLTFNNVRTLEQMAGIVSRQLDIDSADFLHTAQSRELQQELGFTPENVIGLFIPDTYQVYWSLSPEELIRRMAAEYHAFWNRERTEQARKAGLSPMDIAILASIVEEETILTEEYPLIAGVYINRLKRGMFLEACPTLKFALNDFTIRRVLHTHIAVDSPYNTYKHKGLPPGPVRMPSPRAMDAVLNYARHDYIFFCADSDFSGRHRFSKTLKQHNEYAARYHAELNRRNIYQ